MKRYIVAVLVALAALSLTPALPDTPRNVGPTPASPEIPTIGLSPLELTPLAVAHPRMMAASDTVDWSVSILNAQKAWDKGLTGKGVKVAVLDTGIDANHRDLKAAIKAAKDFTRSASGTNDVVGHGTHCAGSIAARKNGWGLVGVAYECDLYVAKVLGDSGSGGVDGIAAGIDWAVQNGVDVISMSLGGGGRETFIPPAFARAKAAGVLLIVAAGNEAGPVSFPGAYPEAFAISAIDKNRALANFSNRGPEVRATGPGVAVRSTYPGVGDGLFADLSGTSMATPNIAGVAALWCQADKGDKKTRPDRFDAWLKANGKPRTREFGYGLPDADKITVAAEPPPKPPVNPKRVKVTLSDLSAEARQKLQDAGVTDWTQEVEVGAGTQPAPTTSITVEQLSALVNAGPVVVGHKVPGGTFTLLDGPADLPPGVYEVSKSLSFKAK